MPRHNTIRRSVALPKDLVEQVLAIAPSDLRGNLNRVVVTALKEYVEKERATAFERAMADMAADPAIKEEVGRIHDEFRLTEADGL